MKRKEKMPSLFKDPPTPLPIDRLMRHQKTSKIVRQLTSNLMESATLKHSKETKTVQSLASLKLKGRLSRNEIQSFLANALILRNATLLTKYYLALYLSTQLSQFNLTALLNSSGTIEDFNHCRTQYQQLSYTQKVFCLELLDSCPMEFNLQLDEFSTVPLFQDVALTGHLKKLLHWKESNSSTKDPAMISENSKVSAILANNAQAIEEAIVSLLPRCIELQENRNRVGDEEEVAELLKASGLERGQFCLDLLV